MKRMSIEPKNMEKMDDLIDLFRKKLPEDEEGTLEIYQRDIVSGELTFIKKILIYCDLFLSDEDIIQEKSAKDR